MRNRLIRLVLPLCAVLLAACSTGTRLAYNNLGTLARWEAGKYIEMTPDQKTAFDREFTPLWEWHRRTQLPAYAATLRSVGQLLETGDPDRAAIDRLGTDVDGYGQAVADRARPGLARLLALMTDEQVEHLLVEQREEFDKLFRKQSKRSLEERCRKEQEAREDAVKTWIGPLSPAQEALLARNIQDDVARGAFDPAKIRAERNRQLDKLAALLADRHRPDFEQRLKAIEDPADAAERQAAEAAQERGRAQLAALSVSMDSVQRQHLRKRLLSFAEDFDALAAQGLTKPVAAP